MPRYAYERYINGAGSTPVAARRGFTLIEILVAISVILVLAGMAFPIGQLILRRSANRTTHQLLGSIAVRISGYEPAYREVMMAGSPQLRRMFDLDRDHVLDADYTQDPSLWNDALATRPADYRGYLFTVGDSLPDSFVEKGTQQVQDNWDEPVRIVFSNAIAAVQLPNAIQPGVTVTLPDTAALEAAGVGLWSFGRDGLAGTADDLYSWRKP
jgi:prepilin-type N-terminal cleavage/methylation domain-containing protein